MTFILGLDVGVTGALAIISDRPGEVVALHDLPIMIWNKTKWVDAVELAALIRHAREGHACRAYVEHTHPTPKLGVIPAQSMGMTLGSTLAALQFAGVSYELVPAQSWKRSLGLIALSGATDKAKKASSLSRARMLFPTAELDRVKDHNRAEALLIAYYGQQRGVKPLVEAA